MVFREKNTRKKWRQAKINVLVSFSTMEKKKVGVGANLERNDFRLRK
jgi:hypothetical protein